MIWQPGEYIFESSIRIDPISFAGPKQAVENTLSQCCIMTAREQIVLAAYSNEPDAVLHFVIVRVQMMALRIEDEFIPACQCLIDGFSDRVTWQRYGFIFIK
jgi:hypothetical protein